MQQCCDGHISGVNHYDCSGTIANPTCSSIAASATNIWADTIILKILANKNALTLTESNKDISTS